MSLRSRWLRVVLRLYPKRFRARYENDLMELYRDAKLPLHAVVWDLVKNALAVRWDGLRDARRRASGRERKRRPRGRLVMDGLAQDLRLASRSLRNNPTFTLVAVATLALGIGTNAAMFSIVHGVLIRDLPYRDPDGIVVVSGGDVDGRFRVSEREREIYRQQEQLFDAFGTYTMIRANVTGDGEAIRVEGAAVDAAVLPTLGVSPVLGRAMSAAEDRPGMDDVVVLSDELWRSRFGASPSVLGRTLLVDGRSRSVLGVLPAGFRLPGDFVGPGAQLFVPLALDAEPDPRNIHYLRAVGRLNEGIALTEAEERLRALSARMTREIDTLPPTFRAVAVPVRDEVLGDVRPTLLALMAAVGLVLLIASVNVAHLSLARSDSRRADVRIRAVLGAGRRRLMAPVLGESVLLATLGGLLGVLLAAAATRGLAKLNPGNLPRLDAVGVNLEVVLFTGAIAVASGLVFGLAPAMAAARRDGVGESGALRTTIAPGRRRLRSALVVGQLAMALMLASGAGLIAKSFLQLRSVQPGFDPRDVLSAQLTLPSNAYPEQTPARSFFRELLVRVRALPGVESVGAVSHLPLASDTGDWGVRIEGREEERLASGRRPWAQRIVVTDGYFETLGTPLLAGRLLSPADDGEAPPVVLVNETMARRYWPDRSPVGARFKLSSDIDTVYRTVVGVVADTRHDGLDATVLPEMYLPHTQFPATSDFVVGTMSLVARTTGDPLRLAKTLRDTVAAIDPNVPVSRMASMERVVAESTAAERLNVFLFGLFGVLALMLVSVGVYGVMAYVVSERLREVGIRMALGARPREVFLSVLGRGAALALIGLAIGLVGALGVGRSLGGLLFGVSWYDPTTFAAIAGVVLAVALAACYFPARRATRVDPIAVLRHP